MRGLLFRIRLLAGLPLLVAMFVLTGCETNSPDGVDQKPWSYPESYEGNPFGNMPQSR